MSFFPRSAALRDARRCCNSRKGKNIWADNVASSCVPLRARGWTSISRNSPRFTSRRFHFFFFLFFFFFFFFFLSEKGGVECLTERWSDLLRRGEEDTHPLWKKLPFIRTKYYFNSLNTIWFKVIMELFATFWKSILLICLVAISGMWNAPIDLQAEIFIMERFGMGKNGI